MTINDAPRGLGSVETARWLPFLSQTKAAPGALALYCLPHAGAGASAYRDWLGRLPGVAVLPVQLPARETRYEDPPYERMAPLAGALADLVLAGADRYAVYGHSFGALVGFELLRELRRRGGPDPVHLFVSGFVPPHHNMDDDVPVMGMSDPELVDLLRLLGGTPDWLLSDPGAVAMILPALRADFTVKETYAYTEEPPLSVPVTAFASTADPRVRHDQVSCWREQTVAEFRFHLFTGGHFAVFEQRDRTHRYITAALAASGSRARR
jgi:surfactin synthase thioesterase subunit